MKNGGVEMSELSVDQIMSLRHINGYWKTLDDDDKVDTWRTYHNYPKERTPATDSIMESWWRTLTDGEKLKRYRIWGAR